MDKKNWDELSWKRSSYQNRSRIKLLHSQGEIFKINNSRSSEFQKLKHDRSPIHQDA